jgi:hypothetical protein
MSFVLEVNTKQILDELAFFSETKQGPFILSRTLNQLAKRVQSNLRADIAGSLRLRRTQWVNQQVKIDTGMWSTKQRLHVTIHLTDPARFISDFEDGGEHVPFAGHTWLTIPNKRVFGDNKIFQKDDELKPANLHFKEHLGHTLGDKRTFIVNGNGKNPLILQRVAAKVGSKRGRQKGVSSYSSTSSSTGLRLLFTLIKHAQRPAKIHWYDTANKTVEYESEGIWSSVISDALKDVK